MKISFIGTGYVGLVSGVMMSHLGHEIVCLDVDQNKILKLKNKQTPIYEPGLNEYIEKYGNSKRLNFVHGYNQEIQDSECLFITVGTPPKENGDADLSGIFKAIDSASEYINSDCVIVIKSTVPPGTCQQVKDYMKQKGKDIHIVSNPEFLREGNAVKDFVAPDRVVVGTDSEHALEVMREVYKPLTDQGIPLVETDLNTSELIKYASNTFLANKIAFINEMSDLCEIIGADIATLAEGIGLDKRIGKDFLQAGPGFGGSCFPKDILALQQLTKKLDSDFLILDAIIKANQNRPHSITRKISSLFGGDLKGKKLAILGLTYKAGTDDLRSSPAIDLIKLLEKEGAIITAYDPQGMIHAPQYFDHLDCANSIEEAVKDSSAIVIATEWPEFKEMDLQKIKGLVKEANIIDLRNIFSPKTVKSFNFKYYSIGRKNDQ